MKNTHKYLTAAAIISSALIFNGCIVAPGNQNRGNNPYQSGPSGYNNPNNTGGYNSSNNAGDYSTGGANNSAGAAGLQDLIGARGGSGETELENRGYSYVKGEKGGGSSYTAWRRGNECVWVRTQNGRYTSIADASMAECAGGGQSSAGQPAGGNAGGGNTGLPFFNATCPGNIDIHSDESNVYFSGKQGRVRKVNPNYFEADGAGIGLSIALEPNGPPTVSYTGKHGASGVCQVTQ